MPLDAFELATQTIGQLLASTTPPLRVPDYQRDYCWESQHVSDFWHDLCRFSDKHPGDQIVGRQYFLGATVFVNNGEWHLLLDGQQRLATATVLLAALRDKIHPHNNNAGDQIHREYISHEDHLGGGLEPKLRLNIFDRTFFRDFVQTFPRRPDIVATKRSHSLIQKAHEFFSEKIAESWDGAGGGQAGFDWSRRITEVLRNHVSLVTVTSRNERNAAAIFETLNDRGIGLSTADLLRSWLLGHAPEADREEIIECWSEVFEACGKSDKAQTLIRLAWVARNGDVKTRALYNVVRDDLTENGTSPLVYSRQLRADAALYKSLRTSDTADDELNDTCRAIRAVRANAAYALLLAAGEKLGEDGLKRMANVVLSLAIRHNVVCKKDRTTFETTVFDAAQSITANANDTEALALLRQRAPDDATFAENFRSLRFKQHDHGIASVMLRGIERNLRATEELEIASPSRVHVEHIYPQTPPQDQRWADHADNVTLLGNMTLLSRRLNEEIKNADFATKKERAYDVSDLEITKELMEHEDWTAAEVAKRQEWMCETAQAIWPANLVTDNG